MQLLVIDQWIRFLFSRDLGKYVSIGKNWLESMTFRVDFRRYRVAIEFRECVHLFNHIRINKTSTSQLLKITGGTRTYFFTDFCAGVGLESKDRLAQGSQKPHHIVLQFVKGVQGVCQRVGSLWGTQKIQ